jgi:hypothetical protein
VNFNKMSDDDYDDGNEEEDDLYMCQYIHVSIYLSIYLDICLSICKCNISLILRIKSASSSAVLYCILLNIS